MTANARYGLQLGSGQRSSIRALWGLPAEIFGMRISADRFTRAQLM
jgi:hypothetical protein